MCVLGKSYPDKDMQLLLEGPLAAERAQYLHGSPTNVSDLRRALVGEASAVFMLTDKSTLDQDVKEVDAHNILATLSLRQINATIPIYVQVYVRLIDMQGVP